MRGLKDELDQRDIGGGYHASVMMKLLDKHHQSIMKELNKMIKERSNEIVESETNKESDKKKRKFSQN